MKKSHMSVTAFQGLWAILLIVLGIALSTASQASTGGAAFVAGNYTITPSADGTYAKMQLAGVRSTMSGGTTGSLGFELWYSPTPFSGSGTLNGYRVAATYLPIGNCTTVNLAAGASCTGIVVDGNLSLPPAGTYYPVLALVEYASNCTTNHGFCSDDYISLTNLTTGGPTVTVGSSGGGGSGGGGTGGTGNAGAAVVSGPGQVSAINWTNDTVDIQVASVTNTTSGTTTGSLALQLWFLTSPYTGGAISGYKVASAPLPASCTIGQAQLSPGTSCTSIDTGTITVTPPPPGSYYAVVALEEYSSSCSTNGGYCLDNAIQLQSTETVPSQTGSGGGTGGSGASSGTYGNAQLSGSAQVSAIDWNSNTVDIHVATVQNTTTSSTTGTLDVELWFTSTPYTSGTSAISGYKVASFRLPASCTTGQSQLSPGQGCSNIDSGTISVTPPPAGTYYAVLSLGEYNSQACTTDGGFCLDNAVALQTQETVPSPTTTGPPPTNAGSSGGGGGGGGGSMDEVALILIALALAARLASRGFTPRCNTSGRETV